MKGNFGDVGHMTAYNVDATFMVISDSDEPVIRAKKPNYRRVIILSGAGNQGGTLITAGGIGAVEVGDDRIEWYD